ncbi:ABC transporter ATP-binding protein [Pseudooceanicola sediminis]|uniref:ABC transporter ATP-binding protein n=1 Tax=Pseudooceanicola sediminis TaxID=2211117 RepID=A0A399J027_9RHOB|nr:ABC transporter transmembrane domain-containing protein [Pseudooceanicola sediminis]RII37899.1 ABC transporter ATP-binding protein [Pseudooceanicola sediminis]|tara:strand:+ start:19251 stop:21932 length:2682 start_codon:yes stop_codon:yes gene_type:complete
MEPNFSRYIWTHTRRQQVWIVCVVVLSMLPYYLALDLPKNIVNGPIQGVGFETPGATQPFLPASFSLPFIGQIDLVGGMELDRISTLIGLSLTFLCLVVINGLFKFYINTYKGLLGERLLRRIRYELVDRILRFQPQHFKHIKAGEISSMVKDEVEPLGGFTGDAFVQPAMLGGQALTAMIFIFVQHFWLGVIALFMAAIQLAIIPRLRRQLIVLGRERQLTARELSGRVAEIADGISTIHTNDTSNFERADISNRLGTIFSIRYRIYQRKFIVKFLNNFLAQLTPFLFYMIGGYLTIVGRLDVGQLIAVINAYKELPGPLKELIDWDLSRQDVQVKYEQVVDQFDKGDLMDPQLQYSDVSGIDRINQPLKIQNLVVEDDAGGKALDHVSLRFVPGETVAIIGNATSGAESVAEVLGGIVRPVSGKVTVGDHDFLALPESVTGRRISYAAADTFFFFGSLRENLLYGLKHRPIDGADGGGELTNSQNRWLAEAEKSGNSALNVHDNWIDLSLTNGATAEGGLQGAMMKVLDVVRLSDQVFEFALNSTFDVAAEPDLADQLMSLRGALGSELEQRGLSHLIMPFEAGSYNLEASVVDNLLFGVLLEVKDQAKAEEGRAYLYNTIRETGLGRQLFDMGFQIAETTLDLFEDLPPDHPFFERLSFMDASEIPKFKTLVSRLRGQAYESVAIADRIAIIRLSFLYVEPHHRFGVLQEPLMRRIIEVRELFQKGIPRRLRPYFERYDQDSYLVSGNMIDNIVLGKINSRVNDAERQVREVIKEMMLEQPDLYNRVFSVGLDYNLGAAGRRLSVVQRQKLNFARALIRQSDYYVFNRPLSALDAQQQHQIVSDSLAFLQEHGEDRSVIWVLISQAFTKYFQRTIVFEERAIVSDENNVT